MNLWLKNKKSCSDENGSDNTINGVKSVILKLISLKKKAIADVQKVKEMIKNT
jgi:hypothetical protein